MSKKALIITGVILGLISISFYKNHISTDDLIGKYVNNNTEPLLDGPRPIQERIDTLTIMENNTFSSQTWGDGTYVLESSFVEARIDLTYSYSMGKAGYEMSVTKPLFGKTRVWLNHDLNFYFEKIK